MSKQRETANYLLKQSSLRPQAEKLAPTKVERPLRPQEGGLTAVSKYPLRPQGVFLAPARTAVQTCAISASVLAILIPKTQSNNSKSNSSVHI